MIEESGRVIAMREGWVWIETIRRSSCSGCSAKGGCGQGLLAKASEGRRNHFRLQTELPLKLDDQVVLGMPESAVFRSSFLAYGLPLVLLVVAVLLADSVFNLSEPGVIAAAVIGLVAGFGILRVVSRYSSNKAHFEPKILRKVEPGQVVEKHCPSS